MTRATEAALLAGISLLCLPSHRRCRTRFLPLPRALALTHSPCCVLADALANTIAAIRLWLRITQRLARVLAPSKRPASGDTTSQTHSLVAMSSSSSSARLCRTRASLASLTWPVVDARRCRHKETTTREPSAWPSKASEDGKRRLPGRQQSFWVQQQLDVWEAAQQDLSR